MNKKILASFFSVIFFLQIVSVSAAENPTCVLMKFTDDTRYDSIDSATILSDRVLKKMFDSKKFNLKEFEPIAEDIEARLYDEKVDELTRFDAAISSGDYNELFEGDGFKENKAQSIATAQVGQIVTPEITSKIGEDHGAEYLVQGTIINLGTGSWLNEDLEMISTAVSQLASVASSQAANILGGSLNFLGDIGGISMTAKGIGVQCDVRLIKAKTGEVVWSKRVLGIAENQIWNLGPVVLGHSNMSSKLYNKALDRAASAVVNELLLDLESDRLFLK